MPSILLSDNGVSSGSAGLKSTAASDGVLVLQTTTSGGTATNAVYIDTSQNVGLGVTPSAWGGPFKAIQSGNGGSAIGFQTNANVMRLFVNNYYNGTNYVYTGSAAASQYTCNSDGSFNWQIAASGTAGNTISFTQAMTLDASGNLGVGTSSPADTLGFGKAVDIQSSSGASVYLRDSDATSEYLAVGYEGGTSKAASIYNSAAGPIKLYTNATERARIDSSGRWLVNTTAYTSGANCFAEIYGGNSSKAGLNIRGDGASGTRYFTSFFVGTNTNVGAISSDGSTTTYGTTSDYRLKENIAPMTGALATVAQLRPCTYSWKSTGAAGQGFIAHELQEVVADAVVGEKDAVDDDGNPKYQSIDTSFLVATLTAAIQELKAENDQLKARLDAANL